MIYSVHDFVVFYPQLPIVITKDEIDSPINEKKDQMSDKEKECLPPLYVSIGTSELIVNLNIDLPDGHHFNEDAPNNFKIESVGKLKKIHRTPYVDFIN